MHVWRDLGRGGIQNVLRHSLLWVYTRRGSRRTLELRLGGSFADGPLSSPNRNFGYQPYTQMLRDRKLNEHGTFVFATQGSQNTAGCRPKLGEFEMVSGALQVAASGG